MVIRTELARKKQSREDVQTDLSARDPYFLPTSVTMV